MTEQYFNYDPDYVVAPMTLLRDLYSRRGISDGEFEAMAKRPISEITVEMNNRESLSIDFANWLEATFGVPSTFWENVKKNYWERV